MRGWRRWIRQRGGAGPAEPEPADTLIAGSEVTQAQPQSGRPTARLTLIAGPPELRGTRFVVEGDDAAIGRSPACALVIPDRTVSRVHARILRQGEELILVHESQTNGTFVNGVLVRGRQVLYDADEIRLADRIVLSLEAPWLRTRAAVASAGLRGAMEARVRLEDRIEREFVRLGSFLDIDVVDSYGMKAAERRVERVVVSFERFRGFVARAVEAHRGQILNCNGDEVAAFFESAEDGFAAARRLLDGLAAFNSAENLLEAPFRVRCGIHTGRSAVDLREGIAYSPILDGAGHLQKAAPVNGLLLSAATVEDLAERTGLHEAPEPTRDGLTAWVWQPGRS